MNIAWILLSTVPLSTSASPIPQSRGLERVPAERHAGFDHRAWEEKLATKDLEQREREYAALLDLAVADDAARDALRAWSTDSARPDLAWTARLALRELERRPGTQMRALKNFGSGAFDDLRGRFDELERNFGGLDSMFDELDRDLERLFSQQQRNLAPGSAPRALAQSESFRIQVGPDGVRVEVDENVDGRKSTRTYTGKSVDEIVEQNPELRDRIGSGAQGYLGGDGMRWFSRRTPSTARRVQPEMPDEDRWSTPAKPLQPNAQQKMRTDILGVMLTKPSDEVRERLKLDDGVGIEVERTEPNTIAATLGVEDGDVLVALNGRKLGERQDVIDALRERKPGEPVKLEVVDAQGRRHTLTWNEP